MTQIEIGSTLVYEVRQRTIFLLKIAAAWTGHQQANDERLTFNPTVDVEQCQVGSEGNRLHRLVVDPCRLSIQYHATANVTPDIDRPRDVDESMPAQMPPEVLTYMNPSRYCESDVLARFAYEEFGQLPPGFTRVQANLRLGLRTSRIHARQHHIATTTASDVLLQRTGVCRDYAHLAISLCRGIGIPARYVSGYAVDLQPPDYHGFMEAFLDGQWYLFRSNSARLHARSGTHRSGARCCRRGLLHAYRKRDLMLEKSVWANLVDDQKAKMGKNPAVSTA